MEVLEQITFWHWLIAGIVFVVIEILLPGVVFLWVGIAAGVTGLVLLAVPGMSWETQFLVFAVLAVISVAAGRNWVKRRPTVSDHPDLNRRGRRLVGSVLSLEGPIVNGAGRVRAGDGTWKVKGRDLPAGARVRVTGVEGATLLVEKEDSNHAG